MVTKYVNNVHVVYMDNAKYKNLCENLVNMINRCI